MRNCTILIKMLKRSQSEEAGVLRPVTARWLRQKCQQVLVRHVVEGHRGSARA